MKLLKNEKLFKFHISGVGKSNCWERTKKKQQKTQRKITSNKKMCKIKSFPMLWMVFGVASHQMDRRTYNIAVFFQWLKDNTYIWAFRRISTTWRRFSFKRFILLLLLLGILVQFVFLYLRVCILRLATWKCVYR